MNQRLASEKVVVAAPMSFAGSAQRLWKLTGPNVWLLAIPALLLIGTAWLAIAAWYVFFGLLLVPYRIIRRGGRKRKRQALQHRELLGAIQQPQQPLYQAPSKRTWQPGQM